MVAAALAYKPAPAGYGCQTMQPLRAPLLCLAIFGGLFAALHRRQAAEGRDVSIQPAWLAAIFGFAAIVLVIGLLTA